MVRDLGSFPRPVLAALAAAERLLTRRSGAGIVLADPEDLGGSDRSVVARARVARLLVLEDLGRSSTLADKLFGPDPAAAQRCLLSWARALGRMQAATAGRENDFGALLRRLGERSWRDPMAEDARVALAKGPALLADELGVNVPPAAVLEAHETARLLGGTRYRAFSPSDTCPDNNLVTSRGVRFVDFEWGCFRDVALDAAYFRVPFPGCEASFALPPGLAETMLEAWRNEISAVWPDLDDPDLLDRRLLHAQLLWVWLCTWWLLPRIRVRDMPVGLDATRSPRISTALGHYWRQMARSAEAGGLPASAELGDAVADALAKRFPDAPGALPIYPAFRSVA
jgi:hypothetical protein